MREIEKQRFKYVTTFGLNKKAERTVREMNCDLHLGDLGGKRIPTDSFEKIEWQESLIASANLFAGGKRGKLLILASDEDWAALQACLGALVCFLEAGLLIEEAKATLVKLNREMAMLLNEHHYQLAQAVHAREFR